MVESKWKSAQTPNSWGNQKNFSLQYQYILKQGGNGKE